MTRELKEESEGRSMYVPRLKVMAAESLRDLIEKVNDNNDIAMSREGSAFMIRRENVVNVLQQDGTYMLLYFA